MSLSLEELGPNVFATLIESGFETVESFKASLQANHFGCELGYSVCMRCAAEMAERIAGNVGFVAIVHSAVLGIAFGEEDGEESA